VGGSQQMYEALYRNKYFLPLAKSSLCSLQYMLAVRNQSVHCPRVRDVKKDSCFTPPHNKQLHSMLIEAAARNGVDLGLRAVTEEEENPPMGDR
jgi:hypothetical protein